MTPSTAVRRLAAFLFAGLGLLALSGHAATTISVGGESSRVVGSGKLVEVTRSIGEFDRLRVDGPIDVTARADTTAALTLRADDNIEPLITTQVEGGTLIIGLAPKAAFTTRNPLRVTLSFVQLNGIELNGSGDVTAAGIKSDRLRVALRGSGDVTLTGTAASAVTASIAGAGDLSIEGSATTADLRIAGSGDIKAGTLIARHVEVSIAGSGDARVHATESLKASVSGSGDIRYGGQPARVSRQVAGSGSIEPGR